MSKTTIKKLNSEQLFHAYKIMKMARLLDEKMLIMLKQGKSYFHIGGSGHEAIQIAASMHLKGNWIYPYYRDIALMLGLGMNAKEVLLGFLAKDKDPSSGGRQMPMHWGHKKLNIVSSSSSTGTQFLQAGGCAFADLYKAQKNNKKTLPVTLVCSGDGTTSQGDFHEALNWASREKWPIIFLIENNHYAISVPLREQRSQGKLSNIADGYEGLESIEVDGCDFLQSYDAVEKAMKRAQNGLGPTLIDAHVVRLLPHSSSDDDKKYKTKEELSKEKQKDPLIKMQKLLIDNKFATKNSLAKIDNELKNDIDQAADLAEKSSMPDKKTACDHILSSKVEPPFSQPPLSESGDGVVLVDAINLALKEEMAKNDKILIFGEDVAGGKGGVFTATRGITAQFGEDRCFNSPLAESSIVGVSIGLATRGYKPVAEIQFGDYIWTAMMQIRNELSTMRYRSNNHFSCPVVLRVPVGGYIHGALCHSQNIESFFAHIPGLKIAMPCNALDAYGLLKTAIRGDDPVLFLEHKGLYRQTSAKSYLPKNPDWLMPFGKAKVVRSGADATIITYGALVHKAQQIASELSLQKIEVEIIDLISINPVDWQCLQKSLKKTNKVLVLHEDCRFMGFGAEIAAELSEKFFSYLDAPIMRHAAKDAPIPYNWDLEEVILPQSSDIKASLIKLLDY